MLAEYRRLLRQAIGRNGGIELDTQGDSLFAVFGKASAALSAAKAAQEALKGQPARVRMGLHTGEPLMTDEGYVGIDVHRAARIAAAGHGGQILVSQTTKALTADADLPFRDLGEHRLKDLTAAERIYQLGDARFPPLRSLNQTNLPAQPTPFVGRGQELQEIEGLMKSSRVVTLTGAGGSGKTRLALQAAAETSDDFPDGVWFISLGALKNADAVWPTISAVIGAREDLNAFLRNRKLLLLLDNLEQLLPEVAPIVASLDANVLATSRERLNISAEYEYPVPTLATDEAIALFVQRARQLRPDFEPDGHVGEIVRRLDGLPLAIELAAARVKVLAPREIAERLGAGLDVLAAHGRDAPRRQRTLQATMEWSCALLTRAEQRAFARLAVFVGGFTVVAAESVDVDLESLASLVDKSLLSRAHGRFDMLEVVRQYAIERFAETSDADEIRLQHARYYLALATDQRPSPGWSLLMGVEHDNVLAALDALGALARPEEVLELAVAASSYWHLAGHHAEGRARLEEALERASKASPTLRARGFQRAASLAHDLGDYNAAERHSRELLRVAGATGEASSAPFVSLGIAAEERGDLDQAESFYTTALENARRAASKLGVAVALSNIGNNALARGDRVKAAALFRESLSLARELGDTEGIAIGSSNLALVALGDGDDATALTRYREAFETAESIGFSGGIIWSAVGVAAVEVKDDAAAATRLLGAADALLRETGRVLGHEERRLHSEVIDRAQRELASTAFLAAFDEGRRRGAVALLEERLRP